MKALIVFEVSTITGDRRTVSMFSDIPALTQECLEAERERCAGIWKTIMLDEVSILNVVPLEDKPVTPEVSLPDFLHLLGHELQAEGDTMRNLEDKCVHPEDRQRSRLRSCILGDLARALQRTRLALEMVTKAL